MVQHALVQRRRAGQHRDLFGRNPLHHFVHVEHRLGVDGRTHRHGGDDAGLVAKGVKERADHQVAVVMGQPHHVGPGGVGPHHLAVRADRPLRLPGGAGGEEDVRGTVAVKRCNASVDLRVGHLPGSTQERRQVEHGAALSLTGREIVRVGIAAKHHHRVGHRRATVAQQRQIVGAQKLAHRKKQPCLRTLEQMGRLLPPIPRVDRHQHRTGRVQTQDGHHPLPTVRRPDGHPVARLDAVCCHRPRQLCGAAGQLRPGEGDVAVDHPRVVAIARCHLGEQRRGGLRSGYIACKRVICWVL